MTHSTYTRTIEVEAMQVTEETPVAEIEAFAPDYRVPAWMRHAKGWLIKSPGGSAAWVPPEDFARHYHLKTEGDT